MAESDRRDEFLIAMYEQLMNDINRHITVVWQSIATLVAAVAVFGFVKDNILSFDLAVSIVILICVWLIWHVYDACYWYSRNLVIISNIERQFLIDSDLKDIHYYFGKHRPSAKMISHLRYQRHLALFVSIMFLAFHYSSVLNPLVWKCQYPTLMNILPWIVAIFGCISWYRVAADCEKNIKSFCATPLEKSSIQPPLITEWGMGTVDKKHYLISYWCR